MSRLILADSQVIFRTGAASILTSESEFLVVAQCANTRRLLPVLDRFPEAIILFASRLTPDPRAVIQRVATAERRSIVVAENGELTEPWFSVGARGAIDRQVSGAALINCVRRVARGERRVQADGMAEKAIRMDEVGSGVCKQLTLTELLVLGQILQGCRNKEIASCLHTTVPRVRSCLRDIYEKTGAADRLELVLFSFQHRELAEAAQSASRFLLVA